MKPLRILLVATLAVALLPSTADLQEAIKVHVTTKDGKSFSGTIANETLTIVFDGIELAVPTLRISSIHYHQKTWTLQIPNSMTLRGTCKDSVLKIRAATGVVDILAEQIETLGYGPARQAAVDPTPEVIPIATIDIDSEISDLTIDPEAKSLWFIEGKRVRKIDTERRVLTDATYIIPDGDFGLRLARDLKTLILFQRKPPESYTGPFAGRVILLHPPDLAPSFDFTVEFSITDLQPLPKGRMLIVGRGRDMTSVGMIDPAAQSIVGLWSEIYPGPHLLVTSDGKSGFSGSRHGQGFLMLNLPEDPRKSGPTARYTQAFGIHDTVPGMLTPDDKFIVGSNGSVARASTGPDELKLLAQTEPHTVAMADVARKQVLLTGHDGYLTAYSMTDWKKTGTKAVGSPWFAAVVDPKARVIYAAVDRRDRNRRFGNPRGSLAVFDLDPLSPVPAPPPSPVLDRRPDAHLLPLKEHELATTVRAIAAHSSISKFHVLDGIERVVRSYATGTGESKGTSQVFPFPVHLMVLDEGFSTLHVLGGGPDDKPGAGRWYQLDPATLAVRAGTTLEFLPHDAALDAKGRLLVTSNGVRAELWTLDPAKKAVVQRQNLEGDKATVQFCGRHKRTLVGPPFQILFDDAEGRPSKLRPPGASAGAMTGRFTVAPDNTVALFESGIGIRLKPGMSDDFSFITRLPHSSSTFMSNRPMVIVAGRDGFIRLASLPDLQVKKMYRLDRVPYAMAFDRA